MTIEELTVEKMVLKSKLLQTPEPDQKERIKRKIDKIYRALNIMVKSSFSKKEIQEKHFEVSERVMDINKRAEEIYSDLSMEEETKEQAVQALFHDLDRSKLLEQLEVYELILKP